MTAWRAALSLGGALVGVAAAGAATTLALRHRHGVRELTAGEGVALGSLRGRASTVVADDGVPLHVEVDEPDEAQPGAATVVLVHGWTLTLDCWHYQRAALRGDHRVVLYDQRSHGRSGDSDPTHCTAEQLGADLAAVLEQIVPEGPIVLAGHSMGGMTVMSYAEHYPERVRDRVVGVLLIGTSAGGLGRVVAKRQRMLRRLSPSVGALLARVPSAVDLGRRLTGGFGYEATRRFGFGPHPVPAHVAFTDQMISAAPASVFIDFWPLFTDLDLFEVLVAFRDLPTVVVAGADDHVTPVKHSRRIADDLPEARLEVLAGAGHMVMLERHADVSRLLLALIDQVEDR